tara:strand:+ start:2487 stop:3803 length:1317 start_codon:yes stop_codon:yes gene_type:complete
MYQGWDFSVYVLNAQYWFDGGSYFEIERAPLMSLVISAFSFLGWKAAEYFYIIFASALFFYSSVLVARAFRFNTVHYYLLSLNAFVLVYGLIEGTELLSLALLQLFLAALLRDKLWSGVWLALACLSRYTLVIFFPLLLLHSEWRRRIGSMLLFCVPFLPWFVYNKIEWGNIFYSIASSVALNVVYREYISKAIVWNNFLTAWNILIPLIIIGLIYFVFREKFSRRNLILILFFMLGLYSVYSLKSNIVRYFIILSIPAAYFATYAISKFSEEWVKKVLLFFVIFTVVAVMSVMASGEFSNSGVEELLPVVSQIDHCAIKSNVWVPLSYAGVASEAFPNELLLDHYIDEGYYVLLLYDAREPDYIFNSTLLHSYPVFYEDENYIVIGEGCVEKNKADASYLERLNEFLFLAHNYTESDDACEILFRGSRLCYLANGDI